MNKKLLAVALASAFAAPAMADGVQIYGAFDVGVLVRGGGNADVRDTYTSVSSGMNGHNFIGFKMSEDLGNGLKIAGDAQFGFNLDSGDSVSNVTSASGSSVTTSTANTGLSGSTFRTITSTLALIGDHGVLVAGRTGGARAAWIKKYDPFGGFGAGRAQQGGEDYANNVIAWVTPEIVPGVKGLVAYTTSLDFQDRPIGKNATGSLYALALMYDQGPASAVVNYEALKNTGLVAGDGNFKVMTAGASYDFGVVKVMGFYDQLTNLLNGWQVGASAPVTEALTVKVGYSQQELRGAGRRSDATDCDKVGVGATYSVSKRTNFYADYGQFTSGQCTITTYGGLLGSIAGSDSSVGAGYGKWGFNAGLRHTF